MPTVTEVKEFRAKRYEESTSLIDRKGADYNRDQQEAGDTLFNLKVCELMGIVPSTEEGILVRLSDKFMRLISLTKPGREAVIKDESVLDTINDIHNYVDYLGLIWQQRRTAVAGAKLDAMLADYIDLGVVENAGTSKKGAGLNYVDGTYYRDGKFACRDMNNSCEYECTLTKGHSGPHMATDVNTDPDEPRWWRD